MIVYVSSLLGFAQHETFNLLLQSYWCIPTVSLCLTPSLWLGRITCFLFASWQHQYRVLWPFFKIWFSFTLFHVSVLFFYYLELISHEAVTRDFPYLMCGHFDMSFVRC